jgi:DNA modification methylase
MRIVRAVTRTRARPRFTQDARARQGESKESIGVSPLQEATTISDILVQHTHEQPKHLRELYTIVMSVRPGTPKPSVRRALYDELAKPAPRIMRVAEGVYIAIDGSARMVLVHGDAWQTLRGLPDDCIDLILTDPPWDLGTEANARTGTTRPHQSNGRTYDLRDIDAEWLREAFRVLQKTGHAWATIAQRSCARCGATIERSRLNDASLSKATRGACEACGVEVELAPQKTAMGPGVCAILTPHRTRQTRKHIQALLDLAEILGFHWLEEFNVAFTPKGMGYWPPQSNWTLHCLSAGPIKKGVPHDLSVTSTFTVQRVIRASKKGHADAQREHESEKPVELYANIARVFTTPGDIILDTFAGRARFAKPLLQSGRHVILVEKDPTWVNRVLHEDWQYAEQHAEQ